MEAGELIDLPNCYRTARCCGFLKIRLEAVAFEPHLWFMLEGPPGTKRVLGVKLVLGRRNTGSSFPRSRDVSPLGALPAI